MPRPLRIDLGVGVLLALALLVLSIVANAADGAPGAPDATSSPRREGLPMITIDLDENPDLVFRIDSFHVPDAAREEFQEAMRRNLAFIRTLPGFLGHVVFEKTGGPTQFNVATIAVWKDEEALEKASVEVGAYYRRIGFDRQAALARWGARAEIGTFSAPRRLQ